MAKLLKSNNIDEGILDLLPSNLVRAFKIKANLSQFKAALKRYIDIVDAGVSPKNVSLGKLANIFKGVDARGLRAFIQGLIKTGELGKQYALESITEASEVGELFFSPINGNLELNFPSFSADIELDPKQMKRLAKGGISLKVRMARN